MTTPGPAPRTWLHWFLVYPTLGLALLGAVPTIWQSYRAWKLDVSFQRVQIAEAQQDLWERNLECLTVRPVYALDIDANVSISVTLCPSGDALLHYQRGSAHIYTWVTYPSEKPHPEASRGQAWAAVLHEADIPHAEMFLETVPHPRPIRILLGGVRCVKIRLHLVLRFAQEQEGQCFLEHIVIASGLVISRVPVACMQRCQDL